MPLERTLAMIKPDAVAAGSDTAIMEQIEANGFTIVAKQKYQLTKEKAEEFYAEHNGKPFFEGLVNFMISGPIWALVLSRENAIAEWRKLMGPTNSTKAKQEAPESLRAKFGTDGQKNATHGSDSPQSAAREIKFHFPKLTSDPLPVGASAREYLQSTVLPVLTTALTQLVKTKPSDPISWLADWLLDNNPNKPKVHEAGVPPKAAPAPTAAAPAAATPEPAPAAAPAAEVKSGLISGKKVVFVLGGPGSGKGTQCERIVKEFDCAHVSAGDLLREEAKSGSEQGNMIQEMMKEGKIVPGSVTINLLRQFLEKTDKKTVLIDGFPREMQQAIDFETGITPCEFVLFFDCPEEVMEERLIKRGETSGRADDNIETIKKRFRTFIETSMPVIAHFEKTGRVRQISSVPTPDEVYAEVRKLFSTSPAPAPITGKKVVFVLGGPGSGKGTQCANLLADFPSMAHVSAGDLLREEAKSGSEQGNMIQEMMNEGKIVPGSVTINLLRQFLQKTDKKTVLIDGFPREMQQALDFEGQICPCEFVLYFDCPEEVMEERLLKRGETSGRADDNIETIKKRFRTFVETSKPVVDHFETQGKTRKISSVPPPQEVYAEVKALFEGGDF